MKREVEMSAYSIKMLGFLVLQTVREYKNNQEEFEGQIGFSVIIKHNLESWLKKVDKKEDGVIEVLKDALKQEMQRPGFFWKKERKEFLEDVALFLGEDFEERVFYQILCEVTKELEGHKETTV